MLACRKHGSSAQHEGMAPLDHRQQAMLTSFCDAPKYASGSDSAASPSVVSSLYVPSASLGLKCAM